MKLHNVIQLFGKAKEAVQEAPKTKSRPSLEKEQLSLGFSPDHALMFVMAADFEAPDKFLQFILNVRPHLILDMRVAPRLDFIGFSRAKTFDIFNIYGIAYKDMFARADIKSYSQPIETYQPLLQSVVEALNSTSVQNEPVLVFFDDSFFMGECSQPLSNVYEVISLNRDSISELSTPTQMRM